MTNLRLKPGHNRGTIFEPVISIDAWRTSCTSETTGSVHVDVTFLEARLGEEPESKVRFKISLKSATIKITPSQTDPIRILPASVDRGQIEQFDVTETSNRQSTISANAKASIGTGLKDTSASAGMAASGQVRSETATIFKQTIKRHSIEQFKVGDSYCWTISSRDEASLLGKVWDPVKEPRCQIVLDSNSTTSEDCDIRIEAYCKREDINIDSIKKKDQSELKLFGRDNNVAVAEAVLKHLLAERGLAVRDISEPFENIKLSSSSICEEKNDPLA
jgi:hypothetical protein